MSDPKLVYVCEGGDCTERGSGDVHDMLKDLVRAKDPHEERVRVRRYPCFGACECGINMTVWPDRLFYSRVTPADLPEIAVQLLEGGDPVKRLQGQAKPDVEEMVWTLLDSPY
ncbi:MAG: (2Fe-2S) ferredoxin domain-containing protein [Planctomycetota bacterium]